jgi:hypothetical protein
MRKKRALPPISQAMPESVKQARASGAFKYPKRDAKADTDLTLMKKDADGRWSMSLLDFVINSMMDGPRHTFLAVAAERYGVSIGTVDRAIGKAKIMLTETMAEDRATRILKREQRLLRTARRAESRHQYAASVRAQEVAAALMGDKAPQVIRIEDTGESAEVMAEKAERLRRLMIETKGLA